MSSEEVVIDASDGFVDFRFPIIRSRVSENGEADLLVGGSLSGKHVEINFHVRAGILPNVLDDEIQTVHALHDGITLSMSGESGRSFVSALAVGYGSDRKSFRMPVELSFTAVALEGDPAKIATEPVKIKLFHETGSTDEEEGPAYFEMFFNIHVPDRWIALNEKDTDFRPGVLNAFPPEPN